MKARYLVEKVLNLRIFPDQQNRFNCSALDTGAELLIISQFTLYADTRRGRRPDFTQAAQPQEAECVLSPGAETERLERFYRLWTAKEAVLKARGKGLRGGAKKVEIPEDFISGERDAATLVETFGAFRLVRP